MCDDARRRRAHHRHRVRSITTFVAAVVLGAACAHGFSPQAIRYTDSTRLVQANSSWAAGPPPSEGDGAAGSSESTDIGPWGDTFDANVELARATSSQFSRLSIFSISGDATASAFLSDGVYSGDAGATTGITAAFATGVGADFVLTATFDFSGGLGSGYSRGQIVLAGHEGSFYQHDVDTSDPSTWTVVYPGMTVADQQVYLSIVLSAGRLTDPDQGIDEAGLATATLEFSLDFGDRDRDGLLDVWEQAGQIDVGDGAVVPLPGADPDHKNLFVEIDVMAGMTYEPAAIAAVVAAFADAPAELVDNPDGSKGITLHVEVNDGDAPTNPTMPDSPASFSFANGDFNASFYDRKDAYLGSPSMRSHALWPGAYRDAWLFVYRYALWADDVLIPPDGIACTGARELGGLAEGIPSNDFVLAAGHIAERYPVGTDDFTAADLVNALAGAFMHELGHTLGLRHGGPRDTPSYQPTYLSVMTYAYATPWVKTTAQGTNARDVWVLDYSRWTLDPLDEGALDERVGPGGPASRRILFNAAGSLAPEPVISIAGAADPQVDWNNDGIISTEVLSPGVDLSRFVFRRGANCQYDDVPVAYDSLSSRNDWQALWPNVPETTAATDRGRWRGALPSDPEMDEEAYLAILAAEWVDHTALAAMPIFADGFETGGTGAWSATAP